MSAESQAADNLGPDALSVLEWLRGHYFAGRPPVYSVQEIARGTFARAQSPAPGSTFDPSAWGRVRQAIYELQARGLVEQGSLPQGDFGYRLLA